MRGQLVTASFFPVIGTPMLVGRAFTEEETARNEPLAVVSESFWRRAMGAAPLPVAVSFDNLPYRVIGVLPAGGEYPLGTQVWLPVHPRHFGGAYNNINWSGIARLRPGVTQR